MINMLLAAGKNKLLIRWQYSHWGEELGVKKDNLKMILLTNCNLVALALPTSGYSLYISLKKLSPLNIDVFQPLLCNSGLKGQLILAQGNALDKKRYVFSALKGSLILLEEKYSK